MARRSFIPNSLIEIALMKEEGVLTGNEPLHLSAMDAVHLILKEVRPYQTNRIKTPPRRYAR